MENKNCYAFGCHAIDCDRKRDDHGYNNNNNTTRT